MGPPLAGGFYLLVEYVDLADDAESEYVFSNLSQSNPFPQSLDPYRDELQGFGLSGNSRLSRRSRRRSAC